MVVIFAKTLDRCTHWPDMKAFRSQKKTSCFVMPGAQANRSLQVLTESPDIFEYIKGKYLGLGGFLLHEEKIFCGFNC